MSATVAILRYAFNAVYAVLCVCCPWLRSGPDDAGDAGDAEPPDAAYPLGSPTARKRRWARQLLGDAHLATLVDSRLPAATMVWARGVVEADRLHRRAVEQDARNKQNRRPQMHCPPVADLH